MQTGRVALSFFPNEIEDTTSHKGSGGFIMKVHARTAFALVGGTAAAILVAGTMLVIVSQPANAKPEFAAQTGKPCAQCHENPAGGGKLKPFGEKFKENGFKLSK
jgi:hypothetical protein